MDKSLCKLTFACPAANADKIIELMLNFDPPLPGFTTWKTEGHGHTFSGATTSELVHGRIDTTMIIAVLPRESAQALQFEVARNISLHHLAYWIEPVESFGQMLPLTAASKT